MKLRLAAALLALAALAVHVGWTRRYRAEAGAAADEYRRLRDERRQAAAEHARSLRQAAAPGRVGDVTGGTAGAEPARAARRLVVGALASSGLSTVKMRVAAGGRAPIGASVHLTGAGELDAVAAFTGGLAKPGNGLVLSKVGLVPRDGLVELSFEALAVGKR